MLKPESNLQILKETIKFSKADFPNGYTSIALRDILGL